MMDLSKNMNMCILSLLVLPVLSIIELIVVLNLKLNNSLKTECKDGDGFVLTSNINDVVLKILYFLKIVNILFIFYLLGNYINSVEVMNNMNYYIIIGGFLLTNIFNIIIYKITPTFVESEEMCNFKKGYKRYSNNTILKNLISIITIIFTYYCIFQLIIHR